MESAGFFEDDLRLFALVGRAFAQDCIRDIVQEVDRHVELGAVTTALCGCHARLYRARVLPPGPGGLPRSGDHCIHEDERAHRRSSADERGGESAERLSDEDHVRPLSNRPYDDLGVIAETRALVVTGEVHRDSLAVRLL